MSILIQGERQSYPLSVTTPHTVWNVEKCPHCKSIVYAEQTKKKDFTEFIEHCNEFMSPLTNPVTLK